MNPLWFVLVPWGVAPLVYLFRRHAAFACLLTSITSMGMSLLALYLVPAQTMEILGRSFVFDAWRRMLLCTIFALATILFLYTWKISQGWSFNPFALAALGALSAALMIDNLALAALLLELAGLVLVFLIQAGPHADPEAALGYLVALVIAGPSLLLASLFLEQVSFDPESISLMRSATMGLVLGLGVLLAAIPFHFYLPTATDEAPPMTTAFFVSLVQLVPLYFALKLISEHLWLSTEMRVFPLLSMAGLLSSTGGGLLAFLQSRPRRFLAYAAIGEMGFILLGLGTASEVGLVVAMGGAIHRSLTLVLMTICLGMMRERGGGDTPEGAARGLPWATVGYLLGGLSLAGFPLTLGFALRWPLCQSLLVTYPPYALGLLLGGAGVGLGFLRSLGFLLGGKSEPKDKEPSVVILIIVLLGTIVLLLGIHPAWLFDLIRPLAQSLRL